MVWPWTLTFWPKNVIRSSVSQDAPVIKVWRKSVNRYWRMEISRKQNYHVNHGRTDGRTHARTDGQRHGRTTRKHIASAGPPAPTGGGGLKIRRKMDSHLYSSMFNVVIKVYLTKLILECYCVPVTLSQSQCHRTNTEVADQWRSDGGYIGIYTLPKSG